MWKSLKEYVTSLGYWGYAVLVANIAGIAGLYLDVSGREGFPTWLWITLLAVGMLIAPFFGFHRVRKERDNLVQSLKQQGTATRVIAVYPVGYQFEVHESQLRLCILPEIHAIPGVRVEDIELEVKGKRYGTNWKPMDKPVSGDIGEWIHADIPMLKAGTYQVRIVACIHNREYSSELFSVEYPQSNPYMAVYL